MYDARKNNGGSLKDGMAFGLFVLLAAAVSFLAAFSGPDVLGEATDPSAQIIEANANGRLTLPDIETRALNAALQSFNADLHRATTARLAGLQDVTLGNMGSEVLIEVGRSIREDGDAFKRMPLRYLNEVVTLSRIRLRKAASRRDPWCAGSSYRRFIQEPSAQAWVVRSDVIGREVVTSNPALVQYFADVGTILLDGAKDGQRNPTRLGPVTEQDIAALEGLGLSLLTDPQILSLTQAYQAGEIDPALDTLNVCFVGGAVLTAIHTLPEETKGRVWAQIVSGEFDPAIIFSDED
ncbi:MAG: hypothetical protein AAF950_13430 [Pseudomonadota bacterium]